MRRFAARSPIARAALRALLLAVLSGWAAPPVQAASDCYTRAEFTAEQGLRLHTEMMVVGLVCQRLRPERDFLGQYQAFTRTHREQLRRWEATLIAHFRRNGAGSATRSFDALRTALANETAQRATMLTTGVFCAQAEPFMAEMTGLSTEALLARLRDDDGWLLVSRPLCPG